MSGVVGVSFLLHQDELGGAPLWMETQNVTPDQSGHDAVMLGSTSSTGLPADIFVGGEANNCARPSNMAAPTIEGLKQVIPQPIAAVGIIKNLGPNGDGFFNANGAHPYENQILLKSLPSLENHTFGRQPSWAA
jgi:hypothetical protein